MFGLRRGPKALPKAKLAPKNLFLFGGLLPFWSTTVFWIPVIQLHMRCMLSRSMRCTKKCKACARHLSTKRAQFFSPTTPTHMLHNQHCKSWTNGTTKFHLVRHVHLTSWQPPTTSLSVSKSFCRENTSTTNRRQKMLSKSLLNHEARIFTLQE